MKTDKDANDILSSLSIACMYWAIPLGLTSGTSWEDDDSFEKLKEQIMSIPNINPGICETTPEKESLDNV